MLQVFERKVLRRIFGLIKEGAISRRRKNQELQHLFQEADIVKVIRLGRLRWGGHAGRMSELETPRRLLQEDVHTVRRVGRPKLRWNDGVGVDAIDLPGVRNWEVAAMDREDWRKQIEEAMAQ
ncbi:uncharacterized protein [Rhodnius prolixus]|uniref:uncharacterized protein n=1 Tax=Rhodnius prolixus TaxID=13249 RepID=UPI003D18B665